MDQETAPHSAPPPVIEVRGASKRYRTTVAVAEVDLEVAAGESVGVLGVNGAGKTTTVEMIAGLRSPDTGTVRLAGLDPVADRAQVRQVLGVQLQGANLHGSLSVAELITLFRSFYPEPRGHQELLDMVSLGDKSDTRFDKLSGGQQQRLSVALALVGRPRVVILDELTTGLDPAARRRMWRTIEALRAEGPTVLLVSHTMEEVERLCDRVLLLQAGRVLADTTPAGLLELAGTDTLDEAFVQLTGHDLEIPE